MNRWLNIATDELWWWLMAIVALVFVIDAWYSKRYLDDEDQE